MRHYRYPKSFPRSEEITIYVNDQRIDVLQTNVAYFASTAFSESEEAVIQIKASRPLGKVAISPFRLGLQAEVTGYTAAFKLQGPELLHLSIEGVSKPLFFYGNPDIPYDGNATYYYGAGQVYEAGEIYLQDGESVYIEGGAIVKGCIRSNGASHIKVYGDGVLDGSYYQGNSDFRLVLLYECRHAVIRDIIMIEPPCWMIMLAACEHIHIDRVKQIGEVVSSDGIDIVGSHDVLVEHCILRNNDDCVVIKAFDYMDSFTGVLCQAARDVYNVTVRACTLVNARAGNAIEIGHELTIDEVRAIRFSDIDIVSVHGHGAPFSIHVGDRALVRDVVFENIRVEHYFDKLVDFRVMKSRFNVDSERGRVEDILLKDIAVTVSDYNPGYSISIIGGYDAEHQIRRITFDNFLLGGVKVTDANQLDLFTKEASEIVFK